MRPQTLRAPATIRDRGRLLRGASSFDRRMQPCMRRNDPFRFDVQDREFVEQLAPRCENQGTVGAAWKLHLRMPARSAAMRAKTGRAFIRGGATRVTLAPSSANILRCLQNRSASPRPCSPSTSGERSASGSPFSRPPLRGTAWSPSTSGFHSRAIRPASSANSRAPEARWRHRADRCRSTHLLHRGVGRPACGIDCGAIWPSLATLRPFPSTKRKSPADRSAGDLVCRSFAIRRSGEPRTGPRTRSGRGSRRWSPA